MTLPVGDGGVPADCDLPGDLADCFRAVQMLNDGGYLLAYHDRSDGEIKQRVSHLGFSLLHLKRQAHDSRHHDSLASRRLLA